MDSSDMEKPCHQPWRQKVVFYPLFHWDLGDSLWCLWSGTHFFIIQTTVLSYTFSAIQLLPSKPLWLLTKAHRIPRVLWSLLLSIWHLACELERKIQRMLSPEPAWHSCWNACQMHQCMWTCARFHTGPDAVWEVMQLQSWPLRPSPGNSVHACELPPRGCRWLGGCENMEMQTAVFLIPCAGFFPFLFTAL